VARLKAALDAKDRKIAHHVELANTALRAWQVMKDDAEQAEAELEQWRACFGETALKDARGVLAERDDYAARLKAVDKSWTQLAAERDQLRAAVERVRAAAQAAKPGLTAPPIDCSNACFSGACDCSANWRPVSWDLDPATVLAVLDQAPAEEASGT
jgi:hypothetical protein